MPVQALRSGCAPRVFSNEHMRISAYHEIMMTAANASKARTESVDGMDDMSPVFDAVARYFALLSDPMRLRIMHALCGGERSVSDIVLLTAGSQANVSRHLSLMHERGALARRKTGSHVYYRVADEALIAMCREVCQRVSLAHEGRTVSAGKFKTISEEFT
jgi:DNA-binding transcriptional ArsR family regulator